MRLIIYAANFTLGILSGGAPADFANTKVFVKLAAIFAALEGRNRSQLMPPAG